MNSQKKFLKNIKNYSAEEIADAVRNGVVSMYELEKDTEGAFTPLLKRRVKELLEQPPTPISAIERASDGITEIESPIMPNKPKIEDAPIIDEPAVLDIAVDSSTPTEQDTPTTQVAEKPGMFRHPFSFTGRIRRTEYGLSMIICFFVNLFLLYLVTIAQGSNDAIILLILILIVFYLWFVWAQGAKRCHDRGNSGWYQIIPFYGLWMLFAEGDAGTNQYGNSPK